MKDPPDFSYIFKVIASQEGNPLNSVFLPINCNTIAIAVVRKKLFRKRKFKIRLRISVMSYYDVEL